MTSYPAQSAPEPSAAGAAPRSDGRASPDGGTAGPPGDVRPGPGPRANGGPATAGQDRESPPPGGWPAGRVWERIGGDWDQADDDSGVPAGDPTAEVVPDISEHARRWAMLSYLGVPFLNLVLPLGIYLAKRRTPFVRVHAAQALNVSITVLLYNISALILSGLLALDTIEVAVWIVAPLLAGVWLAALAYLVLAAAAAGRGEYRQIPGWLCATMAR
jgi:uncharacterized Tic20 family protein